MSNYQRLRSEAASPLFAFLAFYAVTRPGLLTAGRTGHGFAPSRPEKGSNEATELGGIYSISTSAKATLRVASNMLHEGVLDGHGDARTNAEDL